MVAGAVNRTDDLFIHIGFCALQAMSRRGESRPFAADADGLVPAEGAAFVVLKRLDDAVAAGDEILGVIRGIGLSNDGNAGGFLSPAADGQVRAMEAAYAMAGLAPGDISLLECHATGTPVGDATEIESTAQIFHGTASVPIGSLKANLGHLITAAGAAGLIKVLGALRTGIRPPSRPVATPLAALAASPFRLLQAPEAWERSEGAPRRAAVSAFGFGGNNAHLIVEEWIPDKARQRSRQLPRPRQQHQPRLTPIAIVGIEATVGPYATLAAFAQALLDGRGGADTRDDRRRSERAALSAQRSETYAAPATADPGGRHDGWRRAIPICRRSARRSTSAWAATRKLRATPCAGGWTSGPASGPRPVSRSHRSGSKRPKPP